MEFFDFEIRAWQIGKTRAQVMVQASPVGDMRRPLTVKSDPIALRRSVDQTLGAWSNLDHHRVIGMGKLLSSVLLPRPVYNLLNTSFQRVPVGSGLRLRLCLDESLIDLPWEFLYHPDATESGSLAGFLAGFLALDPRVSIVRESPIAVPALPTSMDKQRLVFATAHYSSGQWIIGAQEEYAALLKALAPVQELLQIESVVAEDDHIETALATPTHLFHYAGTTAVINGRAVLAKNFDGPTVLEAETLGNLLREAGTRLAMLSADNSGRWVFVEPLLRGGLPSLIAAQAILASDAYAAFCGRLYSSLAVGLSLDESVTIARLHLMDSLGEKDYNWGGFMVYMPTPHPVLFPRPENSNIIERQQAVTREREQTTHGGILATGQVPGSGTPIDKRALRQAIVQGFDMGELKILCADVEQDLADDGIKLQLSLEMVGGEDGLEAKVVDLINYLDRRSYLAYLVDAARRARPGIV